MQDCILAANVTNEHTKVECRSSRPATALSATMSSDSRLEALTLSIELALIPSHRSSCHPEPSSTPRSVHIQTCG